MNIEYGNAGGASLKLGARVPEEAPARELLASVNSEGTPFIESAETLFARVLRNSWS